MEVHTQVGSEPPSKIIDSLDASLATNPGVAHDLAELEDSDRKLRTLYAFMQSVATTLEQSELFDRILRNLLELFPAAESVAIYIREATTGMMEPRKVMRRDAGPPALSTLPGLFHEGGRAEGARDLVGAAGARRQGLGRAVDARADDLQRRRAGRLARARRRAGADRVQPERSRSVDRPGVAGGDGAAERAHARRVAQAAAAAAGPAARRADPEVVPAAAAAAGRGARVRDRVRPAYSVGGDF